QHAVQHAAFVDHREHAQFVLPQARLGKLTRVVWVNGSQVARHDLRAEDLSLQATVGGLFDVTKESDQIGLLDVERRAQSLLRQGNVRLGEADAKFGRRVVRAVRR